MNRSATLSNSLMLAPLLGATTSLASSLGTLLMFTVVVGFYGLCMTPLRRLQGWATWMASCLLAAALTGCFDILAQRVSVQWHQTFSLYAGLIALQCLVLEHNGFFHQSRISRFKLCGLFAILMSSLGALRELLGHGSLGQGLSAHWPGLTLFGGGLPWITLAPGALILLGLLLAARQAWTRSSPLSKETHHP